MVYDLVIHDGLVVDGTGRPVFRADLGIKDGRIVELGPINPDESVHRIDASGLSRAWLHRHTQSLRHYAHSEP
jgi:N-acyl-D-aspartate/D-glutamate deacylase